MSLCGVATRFRSLVARGLSPGASASSSRLSAQLPQHTGERRRLRHCCSFAALPATGEFSLVRRERHYSRKTSLYHGEAEAGSAVPGSASSSADTSAAPAAPIRCKIASACRSLSSASAVRPVAWAHRPRPASACASSSGMPSWRARSRACWWHDLAWPRSPAQNAVLLACHRATVRRWISRFNCEKAAGSAGPAEIRAAPAG